MSLPATTVLIGSLVLPAALTGAGPQPSPPTTPPFAAVGNHARATAAAVVTVTVTAGSVFDRDGRGGTASLLGRALEGEANANLHGLEARLSGSVDRSVARYQLVAAPHEWREAWRRVDLVLFGGGAPVHRIDAGRDSALAGLAFELGSPASEFEEELASFIGNGFGRDWARPPGGSAESLASLTATDAANLYNERYRREHAVVVVTGPGSVLPSPPTTSAPLQAASQPQSTDAGSESSPTGHGTGQRKVLARDIIATWLAIAYPVSGDTPRTALEFAVSLIRDELDPDPAAPGSYGVDVELVDNPVGTLVLVRAVLHPDAAARWEADALATVREIEREPPDGDSFSWQRRRFRGLRLLEDQDPTLASDRITADLLRDGVARVLHSEINALTPSSLASALLALGEPRILIFGPTR